MKLLLFALCCFLQTISVFNISDLINYPPISPTSRIVGGKDAEDGQAPYQCSMQLAGMHFCGCVIISAEWIATASHCVNGQIPRFLKVLVGTNDLKSGGTTYDVQKYIKHERFNQPNFANDVALIHIKGSIKFNEKVKPIEYTNEEVPDRAVVQLTGWGRLRAGGALPQKLQIINLNAVATKRCKEIYYTGNVHDSHICTLTKFGEGACNGDSGGPLVYNNRLIGLVNFGVPCAVGYPDAYAKVSYLYDWIKTNAKD